MSGANAAGADRRNVDLGGAGVVLAIGALMVWAGIVPVFRAQKLERIQFESLVQSQRELATAKAEHAEVRSAVEIAETRLELSSVELATAKDLTSRQDAVARAILDKGVVMEQLVVGGVLPGVLLDSIPFQISGAGSFPQVTGMMHALRDQFPDMAITSFQLDGSTGVSASENTQSVRFGISVAWYVTRDDAIGG